ncbi:unnamed protein product [Mytilus edulis]|uniref:EGF-like domain-containing protein n=1 Tax=Mytilus edulis TaxID=6550 RepID=A0A8S3QJK5_MYTED|nr:unnamed protein product [Mytilus edulis]
MRILTPVFSKIVDSLRRNDAEKIPELLDLLPNPSNLIWQYDIRNWLQPFIADVRKHIKPLHYRFTMDEVSNKIKLCYKSNHAGPWKISTSGMFMFNDKGNTKNMTTRRTIYSSYTDKYMDFSPLIIFDKVGPKQCIKYCMLYNGCNAVNFNRNDLYCELLNLINVNSQLLDITGIYFTEITEWTQDPHACWPNPCTGQTKCEAAYFNQYICVTYVIAFFTSDSIFKDTPCSSHPCNNGGTCRNQFESFLCSCPAGYHGAVCEYTPCTGQNCNYGSCVVSGSSFYCSCWSGYNGNSCQYTPCTGQNCNYGSCVVSGSSFYCSCWSGYNGNSCQCKYTKMKQ